MMELIVNWQVLKFHISLFQIWDIKSQFILRIIKVFCISGVYISGKNKELSFFGLWAYEICKRWNNAASITLYFEY